MWCGKPCSNQYAKGFVTRGATVQTLSRWFNTFTEWPSWMVGTTLFPIEKNFACQRDKILIWMKPCNSHCTNYSLKAAHETSPSQIAKCKIVWAPTIVVSHFTQDKRWLLIMWYNWRRSNLQSKLSRINFQNVNLIRKMRTFKSHFMERLWTMRSPWISGSQDERGQHF